MRVGVSHGQTYLVFVTVFVTITGPVGAPEGYPTAPELALAGETGLEEAAEYDGAADEDAEQ